jgi:hypothetical protein
MTTIMFRLIPLRSLVRNTTQCVDYFALVDFAKLVSVQRETFAPNGTSPGYDDLPRSWNMMPDKRNVVLLIAGTLELTVYSLQQRVQTALVLTPENVYLNGKIHYGSPAMLEWGSDIFYKMRADDDGCSFVTFTLDETNINEEEESLAA